MLKSDEQWVVRATAADSLGYIAGKAARRTLTTAMTQDPEPIVRRDAAYALSYAGDPSVIPELESALSAETEEQARLGMLNSLYMLGQRDRLPELLSLLQSTDYMVRHAVVNALADDTHAADRDAVLSALRAMQHVEDHAATRDRARGAIASLGGNGSGNVIDNRVGSTPALDSPYHQPSDDPEGV